MTWITANLHVVVGVELWDHFLEVLSSLTSWAELIREWAVSYMCYILNIKNGSFSVSPVFLIIALKAIFREALKT